MHAENSDILWVVNIELSGVREANVGDLSNICMGWKVCMLCVFVFVR